VPILFVDLLGLVIKSPTLEDVVERHWLEASDQKQGVTSGKLLQGRHDFIEGLTIDFAGVESPPLVSRVFSAFGISGGFRILNHTKKTLRTVKSSVPMVFAETCTKPEHIRSHLLGLGPNIFKRIMPQANLTITIPDGIWIGDVTRSHPEVSFRILAAHADGDTGVGLVEITGPDWKRAVADVRADETVTSCDTLQQYENTALVQFETTIPLLLFPIRDSGVPLTMPFTIEKGEAEWEITAPQQRLSELGTKLEEFGIPFTVNEISQRVKPEQILTERQLDLIQSAIDAGYYDTPRRCSLTELAESVDLAKSTCSETLHRAEERIVKQFAETQGDATVVPVRP
jgi:hypothetical protein